MPAKDAAFEPLGGRLSVPIVCHFKIFHISIVNPLPFIRNPFLINGAQEIGPRVSYKWGFLINGLQARPLGYYIDVYFTFSIERHCTEFLVSWLLSDPNTRSDFCFPGKGTKQTVLIWFLQQPQST